MKKTKLLSLITLPLVVGGAGVILASNITNNNEEVVLQNKSKEFKSIVNEGFVKDISLGESVTEVIITDATGQDHLYAWGANGSGQLGIGYKSTYESFPHELTWWSDYKKIKNVETNGYNSAVVVTDSLGYDHLYMFGTNTKGQLGNGTTIEAVTSPTEVLLPQNIVIKDLSLGRYNSLAVVTDSLGYDHIFSWGYNYHGQLGTGTTTGTSGYKTSPQEISSKFGSYSSVKEVETNNETSGAIVTDSLGNDSVYMWGYNYHGQLGINSNTGYKTTPVLMTYLPTYTEFRDLSVGAEFSGVLTTDSLGNDHLYTWGRNERGQLGTNSSTNLIQRRPVEVTTIPYNQEFVDLSFGSTHASLVTKDYNDQEHIYTWGCNASGELGNGTVSANSSSPIEISVPNGEEYNVELGYHSSSVIVTDSYGQNNFYLWGNNEFGQLGNGTLNDATSPIIGGENIDIVSLSTTFIEQVSSEEFIFEISSSVASDLSENVAVYNSNGVKVGDTTLTVKEEATKASSIVYSYDAIITDFDNASNSELYWSIDGGETLNLISENKYEFSKIDNNNVVIYSSIGIGLVVLIILIIIFIVLFLSRNNEKEESKEESWNQQKSNKNKKSKKTQEEENRKKQNDVLDAF